MKKILFATKNKGKAYELKQILNSTDIELLLLSDFPEIDDIPETGSTFLENARIKAKAVHDLFGIPVFADDSGLAVDALQGAPGIFSARYAGENATDKDNIDLLLKNLSTYPEPWSARFVCAAIYLEGETECSAIGEMPGRVITERRGLNGFGYDPIFIPDGGIKTTAELTDAEKNAISHRGVAFRKLCAVLREQNLLS
jgi:XTP/dITP diphosphohydrolase